MKLKRDSNFEEKFTFCWKNDMRIWQTLTRAAESLKIWTTLVESM